MKEFLILCVIIPLLLFFPIQFTVNQINHHRMTTVQNIVYKSAKVAQQDGYFTNENINQMKADLASAFPSVNQSQIIVNCTLTPKYRKDAFDEREMIDYDVQIPIDQILAMPQFFGVSDADNKFMYPVKGQVPSERLLP